MPNIHHQVFIIAPAEKIYDALTSRDGLASWWTPKTETSAGLHSVARFTFGGTYYKEMKIKELKPPVLVKWKCIAGADEWKGTSLSFKLEEGTKEALIETHPEMQDQFQQSQPAAKGTLLIFHHDDWKAYTPMFAECNYTWGQFLKSLKLFCETGKGKPWPNQHSNSME
ncbi:SRPBCC domain-containing protein [Taibaiella lutea]|uniref:SRPBCC domain-containing protein n=1 Tax=Taibaiella lutea TaxID=2608001 RepID=A0A5M6CND3_9BACT|nr:SRPBCC domain-containing protein [Taibaiella lutea]KAA5536728.1 SRPBCC domain-containing protein [Taibaiella lutea]